MRLRPLAAVVAAALSVSALSLTAAPALADGTAVPGILSTVPAPSDARDLALSPDGSTAYVLTPGATKSSSVLSAVTVATGAVAYKVKVGLAAVSVVVSPDGSTVYVPGAGGVAAISTASHAITAEPRLAAMSAAAGAVSPDGSTLYLANSAGSVDAISTSTFAVEWSATLTAEPTTLVESPDGSTLYTSTSNPLGSVGTIYSILTTTHAVATLATVTGGATDALSLSADGTTLYSAGFLFTDLLTGHYKGVLVPVAVATGAVGAALPIVGLPQAITQVTASSAAVLSLNLSDDIEHLTTVDAAGATELDSAPIFGEYIAAASSASGASYLVSDDGKLAALGAGQQLSAPASVKVTGTDRVGSTLTAHAGTWTPGTILKYQWFDEAGTIPGATKAVYKVPASERGYTLGVAVIGIQPGYVQSFATSKAVKVAAGKLATKPVSIVGTVKVGKTVKAKHGAWTTGTKYTVQWYANGKAIKGAKKSTLKISASLAGKKLTVKLTGAKTGYAPVTVTSKAKLVPKAKKK